MKGKDDQDKSPEDCIITESKTYLDKKRPGSTGVNDKKKKSDDKTDVFDKNDDKPDEMKKERKDKQKDSPRETKTKRYSESRKERLKQSDAGKSEKTSANEIFNEVKVTKSLNHNDIKPFTQLPQLKTDDLVKVIEEMDRKLKLEEQNQLGIKSKDSLDENKNLSDAIQARVITKVRRNSCDAEDSSSYEDCQFKRQNSEDSGKSSREDSVEKERNDERREKRIRNKVVVFFCY